MDVFRNNQINLEIENKAVIFHGFQLLATFDEHEFDFGRIRKIEGMFILDKKT